LTYSLPAWVEFLTADLTSILNSLLKKCFECGYIKQCNKISQLIEHVDDKLFAFSINQNTALPPASYRTCGLHILAFIF
jgi:hypothetical protein